MVRAQKCNSTGQKLDKRTAWLLYWLYTILPVCVYTHNRCLECTFVQTTERSLCSEIGFLRRWIPYCIRVEKRGFLKDYPLLCYIMNHWIQWFMVMCMWRSEYVKPFMGGKSVTCKMGENSQWVIGGEFLQLESSQSLTNWGFSHPHFLKQ